MKKRANKRITFFAIIAMVLVIVVSSPSFCVEANEASASPRPVGSINAADVLSLQGYDVSDEECDFLSDSDFLFSYNVPALRDVSSSLSGNELYVSAQQYVFMGKYGEVVWTPKDAYLDNKKISLDSLATISDSDGDVVTVRYEACITIPMTEVNEFINKAYDASLSAYEKVSSEQERYLKELAEYNELNEKYEAYLKELAEYNELSKKYEAYLKELAVWNSQNEEYQNYLAELEIYEQEKAEYDNFDQTLSEYYANLAAYRQYLEDLKTYEKKKAEYDDAYSSSQADTARYHLAVLDYIKKEVNKGRTLYGAIMGDAVTQVLSNTEALVLAGAERAAVERANKATVALRSLLSDYDNAKTDEEKYAYYVSYYQSLKENFVLLLQTLDYFYSFSLIRNGIASYDATEKYEILLAQLYYISCALSNGAIPNYVQAFKYNKTDGGYFDSSYRIGPGKKTPLSLVGENNDLKDTENALPLESGYPSLPDEPKEPTKVSDPGGTPVCKEPIPPEVVQNPGEQPKAVTKPQQPIEVQKPEAPQKPEATQQESKLALLYENGTFYKREQLSSDCNVALSSNVTKYFRNAKIITVRFFDDARTPLYSADVEAGDSLTYPYELPTKQKEGYSCEFDYWQDESGNKVDLSEIRLFGGDLNLYPHFNEQPLYYQVNWVAGGVTYRDSCAYDSSPIYDEGFYGTPSKPSEGVRAYRFVGWRNATTNESYALNESLPLMTTDEVTYEAVFEGSFVVTVMVDGVITQTSVWGGETPVLSEPIKQRDSYYSYEFIGWDKSVEAVQSDVTYIALFKKELLCSCERGGVAVSEQESFVADCSTFDCSYYQISNLLSVAAAASKGLEIRLSTMTVVFSVSTVNAAAWAGVDALEVDCSMTAQKSYKYAINIFGEQKLIDLNVKLVAYGRFDAENSFLNAIEAEGEQATRFTVSESQITFTAKSGTVYEIKPQYVINVVPSELVEVTLSAQRASQGQTISVNVSLLSKGTFVSSIYAIDALGNSVKVENGSFVMPRTAVTVGVVCSYYEYVVTFKVDGKTFVTKKMRYGEQIEFPSNPTKPSNGEFSYSFVGWDNDERYVSGDVEFNAVFEAVPVSDDYDLPQGGLNKAIKTAYVVVPIVVLAAAGFATFMIIRKKRKVNRKK